MEITVALQTLPEQINEIDARILVAEKEGDAQTLAELVPQHHAFYTASEKYAIIQQALDDWRIVHFFLFRAFGHQHAYPYFHHEHLQAPELAKGASTRMDNAKAMEFWHHGQGWDQWQLVQAGIEKLRRLRGFAEKLLANEGELHEDFVFCMQDTDTPINRVVKSYRAARAKRERGESDVDGLDEELGYDLDPSSKVIFCYSEGKVVNLHTLMIEMVAFSSDGVGTPIGYLLNTDEALTVMEDHIAGNVRLVMR